MTDEEAIQAIIYGPWVTAEMISRLNEYVQANLPRKTEPKVAPSRARNRKKDPEPGQGDLF